MMDGSISSDDDSLENTNGDYQLIEVDEPDSYLINDMAQDLIEDDYVVSIIYLLYIFI